MYNKKYLNIKYGGAYDSTVSLPPTIKIINISGETIVEFPTEGFTIETLVASPELDFYNSVFRLLHELVVIYSDDDKYETNSKRIIDFALHMQGESCTLSIVQIANIYTDSPPINPPENKFERPEEIPGIITFNNGELVINLYDIPNIEELNYLNLSSYKHGMIEKITTISTVNNFLKIILPNNPNIKEIGDSFFSYSEEVKRINFNNLSNLKTIQGDFLSGCGIEILDLENCINLTVITESFIVGARLNSIKLPHSIQRIECGNLYLSNIEILDLSNCVNLIEIKDDFAIYSYIKLIKLPVSIKKIGLDFLRDSSIELVDLKDCINLTEIPTLFLHQCKNLQFVILPPQLQHMEESLSLSFYTYSKDQFER
jgi:hypothetical protein